ncbi:MAG: hypothetical protein KJO98_05915, partial [Rhodothermia bacterium]|nr:hypothetical protein [Rhodothermia bacterium]
TRPVARIAAVNELPAVFDIPYGAGRVSILRKDPITAPGGRRNIAGTQWSKYPIDGCKASRSEIHRLVNTSPAEWVFEPFAEHDRKTWLQHNSHFLYNGDKIKMAAAEGLAADVRIVWEGGASGRALFTPKTGRSNEFTVGPTRSRSGEWKDTLKDTVAQGMYSIAWLVKERADKEINWTLQGPLMAPAAVTARTLVARIDGTLSRTTPFHDIVYVNVNSLVNLRIGEDGQLEVYTLEGNPEFLYNNGRSRLTVPAGQMVSYGAAQSPQVEAFDHNEIDKWWERAEERAARIYDIPSFNATVSDLLFYEEGEEDTPYEERTYRSKFPMNQTRYICWELKIEHPERDQKIGFEATSQYYKADGSLLRRHEHSFFLRKNSTVSLYSSCWGNDKPGSWEAGEYRLDVVVEGRIVASRQFEVGEIFHFSFE